VGRFRPGGEPEIELRIALDATYAVGGELSGIGVFSRALIEALAEAFPDDILLLAFRPHRFLRSFTWRTPPNSRRRLLFENVRVGGAEVFHGLNQRLPSARYRCTVSTFHDLFVLTGEYSTPEFRARFARQARDAAGRSDRIIAVSRFTARQVRDLLGVEESRIRVVPHGVRLPERVPRRRRPMVLHVGAIQARKNLVRLVRAFQVLPPEWRLVLAGGRGYGAERVFETIASSPARDRIDTPGYVSRARLEQLYATAGLLAFPSLDEGFGIPVLEAMAWGLPVLTSNRSALPEVGGEAVWYVDPLDEDELADGLSRLAGDPGLRERLSRRGRERAAQFRWEDSARAVAAVYREAAG